MTLLDKQAQVKHHPNPCRVALENPFSTSWEGGTPFPPGGPGQMRGREADPDGCLPRSPPPAAHPGRILPRQLPEQDRQLLKMAYEEGLT